MRKFLLALLATLLLATPALAAGKIGLVNMRGLATKCEAADVARKKMKEEFGPEAEKIKSLENELKKQVEEMKVQAAALSPQAREDKKVEAIRMKRDLEDKKRAYARKLQAADARIRKDLSSLIVKGVKTFAKNNGYDLILDNMPPQVLYATENMDVTSKVLVEVNRIWREGKK